MSEFSACDLKELTSYNLLTLEQEEIESLDSLISM